MEKSNFLNCGVNQNYRNVWVFLYKAVGGGITYSVVVDTNKLIYTFSIVSPSHHVVIFTRSIKRINP